MEFVPVVLASAALAFVVVVPLVCYWSSWRLVKASGLENLNWAEVVPEEHTRYALWFLSPKHRFCRVDQIVPSSYLMLQARYHEQDPVYWRRVTYLATIGVPIYEARLGAFHKMTTIG